MRLPRTCALRMGGADNSFIHGLMPRRARGRDDHAIDSDLVVLRELAQQRGVGREQRLLALRRGLPLRSRRPGARTLVSRAEAGTFRCPTMGTAREARACSS